MASQIIKNFICPSDSSLGSNIQRHGYGSTNYAANLLVLDPRGPQALVPSMPDGLSQTVLFTGRYKSCPDVGRLHRRRLGHAPRLRGPRLGHAGHRLARRGRGLRSVVLRRELSRRLPVPGAPQVSACDWYVAQGAHTGVMLAGLGDGSVRGVATGISVQTWIWAGTPNDGNPLPNDW